MNNINEVKFEFIYNTDVFSRIMLEDKLLGNIRWFLHAKDNDFRKYTVSFNSRLNPSKRTISNQSKRRDLRNYKISNKAKGKLLQMASNLPMWASNRGLDNIAINVRFQYLVEHNKDKLPMISDVFNITYSLNDHYSIKYVKGL